MNSHIMILIWLAISLQAFQVFASIPGYITIDCGVSEAYERSNVSYDTDEGYIATGRNMAVDRAFQHNKHLPSKTVRSFPEGERNCYTLKPLNGTKSNYLIRAWFMYGNYDGKNNTPTFDIYIGVNYWTTIILKSVGGRLFAEILHKPTIDLIYICLVNTGGGTPFISELLLRPLDNSLYDVSESASLNINERYITGIATEDGDYYNTYPGDVYDRFWTTVPLTFFPEWGNYTINTKLSSLKNDEYRVPPSIFRTGAMPGAGSSSMNFFQTPNDPLDQVYFYLHFAETHQIANNESREFNIFVNGNPISESIKLRYLEALTIGSPSTKLRPGDSSIWISFNMTKTSTLPPILNAIEVYAVIRLPQSATDQDESNAVIDIKTKYLDNGMKNWQGDPCLPKSPWAGLICSDNGNDSPRIVSLNLASMGLDGEILPSLFSLTLLKNLNLSNNNLRGTIPEFLADMPSLQDLDLSGNKLGGSVPIKLINRMKNGSLFLRFEGNPNLCTSDTCREASKKLASKKHKVFIPVAAAVAVFALLTAIAGAVVCTCKRKRKAGFSKRFKIEGGMKSKNQKFTYSEVISMTDNFERVVGRGGFGTVYHGSLNDGTEVAVKVLKQSSAFNIKSFQTEAELLMRVHHRNLVSLVGYCEEGVTMALIYEYMANGDLRERLSGEDGNILSWKGRLQIIIDAAQGLDYLHNGCKPAIVHRDMKPANILLDDKMQARIADFGMSRIFSTESKSYISTENVTGTPGYLDPEYGISFRLTEKSDVYSFGIILLELITGRAAITMSDEIVHVINWVTPLLSRGDILNIVDQRLQGNFNTNSAWTALEIAMTCVSPTRVQRPSMTQVLADLKECLALELASEKARDRPGYESVTSSATLIFEVDSDVISGPQAR